MSQAVSRGEIPGRVKEALVTEYGETQDRCVRGYVPSQSIQQLMDYLDPVQIQQIKGERITREDSQQFAAYQQLPDYVTPTENITRRLKLDYRRSDHKEFEWGRLRDFLIAEELDDIAINKLVLRMENTELRDHLFTLLRESIGYPPSYKAEFTEPFFFVMESRAPEKRKDYDNVSKAHDDGYLKELGWNPRCLDLMAIWSYHAWTKSGNRPMGVTQHDVEELAFNRRESDEPVFGAVNSKLVVNKWREPFGRGLTDMRKYQFDDDQRGWVRTQ